MALELSLLISAGLPPSKLNCRARPLWLDMLLDDRVWRAAAYEPGRGLEKLTLADGKGGAGTRDCGRAEWGDELAELPWRGRVYDSERGGVVTPETDSWRAWD